MPGRTKTHAKEKKAEHAKNKTHVTGKIETHAGGHPVTAGHHEKKQAASKKKLFPGCATPLFILIALFVFAVIIF
jgi:hypothetical protein